MIETLIDRLIDLNINIELVENDNLKIHTDIAAIPKELLSEIRLKKEDLVSYLKANEQQDFFEHIPAAPPAVHYPLSSSQKRIWVLSKLEGGNTAYNVPGIFVLDGQLDKDALRLSFEALSERHETLRTVFREDEQGAIRQFIRSSEDAAIIFNYKDLCNREDQESVLEKLIENECAVSFDLSSGSLWRVLVCRTGETKWLVIYVIHHIISDGWSMNVLMQELLAYYNAFVNGGSPEFQRLRIQYKDYAAWQQEQLQKGAFNIHRTWWLKQLAGELPVLAFPYDTMRPLVKTFNGAAVSRVMHANLTSGMRSLVKEQGATLFMGLLAAVDVLLQRYTGQEDIIIGTPIAGREHADLKGQVGFYVNTVPLRLQCGGEYNFRELLSKVKGVALGAYEHQAYPLDELLDELKIQRDTSRNTLFDVLIVLENNDADHMPALAPSSNLKISAYEGKETKLTKLDIAFSFLDMGDDVRLSLEYNRDIYNNSTMNRLADHFLQIIAAIIEQPMVPILALDYLTKQEKQQLTVEFNNTEAPYSHERTVVDLFEDQVLRIPDHTILLFGERMLKYEKLNEAANQLAHYLRQHYGVKPGEVVGIHLDRSDRMIIAILAVMKSGAAYMPIDTEYPVERVQYMMSDSGSRLLIDENELIRFSAVQDTYNTVNLKSIHTAQDLAYVIYTSGTTGQPKGVMIEHRNLYARIKYLAEFYSLGEADRILFYRSYSFDGAIEEYLLPLLTGACCVVAPMAFKQDIIYNIVEHTARYGITKINMPPILLNELVQSANASTVESLSSLRHMVSGGDKLTSVLVNQFLSVFTANLYNSYGPTENTIDSTNWKAEKLNQRVDVPIGRPVQNAQAYILDNRFALVPVGVLGELYVSGAGLARGYLNKPELTAEKFVANPFREGEMMYRTGDLGRWLEDGTIGFMGRKDEQVKVRGYRIELGEVVHALRKDAAIDDAAVIVRTDEQGANQLVAYLVSKIALNAADVRMHLARLLPYYMLPDHYVQLEKLPLNTSGKIDRKALPDPSQSGIETGISYQAPRNDLEQQIVTVYEEILKKQSIGIRDDFFVLGGDSIKSIQVVARLKQRGLIVTIRDVMLYPIIEDLARQIKPEDRSVDQDLVEDKVPLGPIQQWFFSNDDANRHHYNQSVLLQSKERLSESGIRAVLDTLVLHHDALRMVYYQTPEGWVQENKGADQGYSFEAIPYTDEASYKAHCDRIQSGINLSTGPLLNVALFQHATVDRLLLVIHHLVTDGVSWRILFEDISTLYQQYLAGVQLQLPLKTDSFKYWQEQQQAYAQTAALQNEASYWDGVESSLIDALPVDYPEGTNLVQDVRMHAFELDAATTDRLLTQCYKAYKTEINDVLLTALSLSLQEVFGMNRILVHLEGHGREDIGSAVDVSRTVGWFTTVYPVVLELDGKADLTRQLVSVKESLHRVPNKGIGYGILRYVAQKEYQLTPVISFVFDDLVPGDNALQRDLLFTYSSEYQGKAVGENRRREFIFQFIAAVRDGRLQVTATYSGKQFIEETVQTLLATYKQQLELLVDRIAAEDKEHLTPVDFTYKELSVQDVLEINRGFDVEDVYPLTPFQQGLYFHWLSAANSPIYFEQTSHRLKANLDAGLLQQSYQALVARHAVLRTCYTQDFDSMLLQIVKKEVPCNFQYIEVAGDDTFSVEKFRQADRSKGFDLSTGSQMRLTVIGLGDNTYEFVWSHHHILMDGWCGSILIKEFFQFYDGLLEGKAPVLNKVSPYSNYIEWLQKIDTGHSLQFWKNYLAGYEQVSSLPAKLVKTPGMRGARRVFALKGAARQGVRTLCGGLGITENTFIQTIWGMLLARYNNTDDIVFGAVVSGRPAELQGVEETIGLFINAIPVRIKIKKDATVKELLKDVQRGYIEATPHHYVQLAEVQSQSELGRNLFDHMLLFENFPVQETVAKSIDNFKQNSLISFDRFAQANYDFMLIVQAGEAIEVKMNYNENVYDSSLVARLQSHFIRIVEQVLSDPNASVFKLDYLSEQEKYQLLTTFNSSPAVFGLAENKTLVSLFDEQVKKTPDAVALVFKDNSLTYRQLDAQANKLANHIRDSFGIDVNDLVALMVDRSDKMLIAMIGILKAGAAFVPIDIELPGERRSFILNDTGVKLLITQMDYIFNLDVFEENVFAIDLQLDTLETAADAPLIPIGANDLAYVIYTSGSTGEPKGVMVEHRGIVNTILAQQQVFDIKEGEKGLQFAASSFDASVSEIFIILFAGGILYVIDEDIKRDPALLEQYITRHEIDIATIPPAYLRSLQIENINSLAKMITAGEAALPDKMIAFSQYGTYYNAYGPTETSICASIYTVERGNAAMMENVPIGVPIPNVFIYITDNNLQLLPEGVVGEICIGGAGLARGYLNKPELTAEKFVANPFREGEMMYRTGDLGRWLEDGNISFIGRKDEQVKVRGYRVELGEIENALRKHVDVTEVVVVTRADEQGGKQLVAYVISKLELNIAGIRTYLSKLLPAYMLPDHYVQLEKLPLTSSGKINKKVLPDPLSAGMETGIGYQAPRNDLEQQLVTVYEEILKKHPIGIKDDFFVLGGDSIKSIQIVARLSQRGYTVAIQDILLYPVIEDLVSRIKTADRAVDQRVVEGMVPLGPIQQWFFSNDDANRHHYNQSVLLQSKERLSESGIRAVLDALVLHHDALRMVYYQTPEGWVQENKGADQGYSFEAILCTDEASYKAHCDRIQSGINLSTGPLLKVALFQHAAVDRLLLVIHHLVTDGVSWRILFEDISTLYQQYLAGEQLQLPLKTDSFKYWQEQQQAYAQTAALQNEASYWDGVESSLIDALPVDYPEGTNLVQDVRMHAFELDAATTDRLLTQCYKAYKTEINDVLLTALSLSLQEVFGMRRILVHLEGHGREDIGSAVDVSRTVGWFTTVYPVVLELDDEADLTRQLVSVKESLHRVPNKGIGYGILRYLGRKDYRLQPMITFNYLGDFGTGVETAQQDHLFDFCGDYHGRETPGSTRRSAVLDISGRVVAGKMMLTISYNSKQYGTITIEGLLAAYKKHLKNLIDGLSSETHLGINHAAELLKENEMGNEAAELVDASFNQLYYLPETEFKSYVVVTTYASQQLHMQVFKQAVQQLIERHEVLRTAITRIGGIVMQKIWSVPQFDLPVTDPVVISSREELNAIIDEEHYRMFDLEQAPLFLVQVFKLEEEYHIVITTHHIVTDGYSDGIFEHDLKMLYARIQDNESPALAPLAYQYRDFASWQKNFLGSAAGVVHSEYWKKRLHAFKPEIDLAFLDLNAIPLADGLETGIAISGMIGSELFNQMDVFVRSHGLTRAGLLMSSLLFLLHRLNGQEDITLITPVSGRDSTYYGTLDVSDLIGCLANGIFVRNQIKKEATILEQLQAIQYNFLSDLNFSAYPFVKLMNELPGKILTPKALNNIVVYNYHNYSYFKESFQLVDNAGADAVGEEILPVLAVLGLTVKEYKNCLKLQLVFNSLRFNREQRRAITGIYFSILHQVINDPHQQIDQLPALNNEQH